MNILRELFGTPTTHEGQAPAAPAFQVALIFTCDMVENNERVLNAAVDDLLRAKPGELVGKVDITVAPNANTNTITMTLRVADQKQAFAFQKQGESILRRHGLRS